MCETSVLVNLIEIIADLRYSKQKGVISLYYIDFLEIFKQNQSFFS